MVSFLNNILSLLNRVALLAVLVGLCSLSLAEPSSIYIRVGEATVKKSLIALPPFQFFGSPALVKNFQTLGAELFKTIQNDLDTTALFQFIAQDAFLEDVKEVGLTPAPGNPKGFNFENWKTIGAEFLLRSGFSVIKDQIEVEVYLYHVPQAKTVMSKKYRGKESQVREIAHRICNDIIYELTGQPGMFLSRIVVASDRSGTQWKEIYVMDWDGANPKKISNHRSIVISPTWSPNNQYIAYTAYSVHTRTGLRNADLFLYDYRNSSLSVISARPGINSGAAFLPDSNGLLLTISQQGNPDIFQMSLDGKKISPLTSGPRGAMNVEPAISPAGDKIAFSSDRSGKPMIYIMNRDGSNPKRVTFAGRYNATPSWSPDGKKIAFAGFDEATDHFDIFVMDSTGYNMSRLTTAMKVKNNKYSNNEDPVFSPNGMHVMFVSDRTGKKQIYIVNTDGTNERRITFDQYNYFKPKWSRNFD